MSTTSELVERLRLTVMYDAFGAVEIPSVLSEAADHIEEMERENARLVGEVVGEIIDAFLSKLSETHAIVPREPTEAMVYAGSVVLEPDTNELDVARDVWGAMIAAAEGK
jgi:hypothetical protein